MLAVNNRVSFVEESMHKEQAAILKLRGLEQKREKNRKTWHEGIHLPPDIRACTTGCCQ